MYSGTCGNWGKYFFFSFILISIILSNNSINALTFHGHTTDLDVYRFTQILDVSENEDIDIWTIIQLRFNQSEDRTDDYYLYLDLYPIKGDVEVFPEISPYKDYIKEPIIQTEKDPSIKFYIDGSVNKKYEYYTFAFRYHVSSEVITETNQWYESFIQWQLTHYSGIPQTIGNYVRIFIVLPENIEFVDKGDYSVYDDIPKSLISSSYLSYDYNKTVHETIYVEKLNETIFKGGKYLFKSAPEEVSTSISYKMFTPKWYFTLILTMICTVVAICFGIWSALYKPKKFSKIILLMIATSIGSSISSGILFTELKIALTIQIAWISLIVAVFTIHNSERNTKKTNKLILIFESNMRQIMLDIKNVITDFRKEYKIGTKELKKLITKAVDEQQTSEKTIKEARESVAKLESKPIKQKEIRQKIKTTSFRNDTMFLVKTIIEEIKNQFPNLYSGTIHDDKKIIEVDVIFELPDKLIPVEIKRYPKRLIGNHVPRKLIESMKFIMQQTSTNEALLIIMNPGIRKDAYKILKEGCLPNRLHIIHGSKTPIIKRRLIKLLKELKNR
jgi:hypothetical protein